MNVTSHVRTALRETRMKQLVFPVVVVAAHAIFIVNEMKFVKVPMLGRPANQSETWGQRIASLMALFFGQGKVIEEKSSWHHRPI